MAAVASRTSHNSPHPNSHRMSSPKDAKRNNIKSEEAARKENYAQNSDDARSTSSPRLESSKAVQPPDSASGDTKPSVSDAATAPTNGQPLGPPPRPNASDAPDYFNQVHNAPVANAYRGEPNPFEVEFGNPSSETPGKQLLPPVASLTSPQPLLPAGTPGWGSLRSGPLSPAMLAGPTGTNDYFGDAPFSRGFPTPNESSLRTGLTPGGGGSMFPAPSPNTQAIFNALQPSGGATPGTLDFLRTVNRASAAAQASSFGGPTSQPAESSVQANMDKSFQQAQPQPASDPFGHPDANDAANGLYMLAQANGARTQYPVQSQPPALQTNLAQMGSVIPPSQETSPLTKAGNRASLGTISGDTADFSESDHSEEQAKPATRSRGRKTAANNRRKAEEPPAKTPANKRTRNASSKAAEMMMMSDDDMSPKPEDGKDTKKMTDEEKRKNFLERNRIAALKCRQRKKQWLANLQAKVELFSTENDALSQTVTQLREEIVNLRSLLLAHRECPVSVQQGLAGGNMNAYLEGNHHNPYGMAGQPNGIQGMAMQMPQGGPAGQIQRR